jgi:hypothetical protein
MSEEELPAQITIVRSPNLTDDEIRRRWKAAFDISLGLDPPKRAQQQKAAPEKVEQKPPDTIGVTDDLVFEADGDHLMLRRGKAAIMVNPNEVRALLVELLNAAARLLSCWHQVRSDPTETTASESIPADDTDKAKVCPFFSSVLDWLTKMPASSDKELEILR